MKAYYEMRDHVKYTEVFTTCGCDAHFHQAVEILVCEKGRLTGSINDFGFSLNPGEIAFANCYDIHWFEPDTPQTVGKVMIIPEFHLMSYLKAIDKLSPKEHILRDPKAYSIIYNCYALLENYGKHNALFLQGVIDTVLGTVVESLPYSKSTEADVEKLDCIRGILVYIHTHYTEEITLNKLSAHVGYNPYHFSHLFNTYFKTNLNEYVNNVRANAAHQLIRKGTSVTDAAFEAGFSSLRTFYRAFSKVYGVEPKQIMVK